MMQQWADYLHKLKTGADLILLHGQAVKFAGSIDMEPLSGTMYM
jgi:hypothetical protein